MPVIITGTFILPDGDVAADRVITVRRASRDVVQQSGLVVLPDDIVIETDITGQVMFYLMPGNYVGFARTASGQSATFTMAVPDVESVDIAAVVNADDIPEGAPVGPPGPAGPPGPVGPSYNYRGNSFNVVNQQLSVLDAFTHLITVDGVGFSLLLKPKAPIIMTAESVADVNAIQNNYDIMLSASNGANGANGSSAVITTVNSQAAFDAATPGPLELVVRID